MLKNHLINRALWIMRPFEVAGAEQELVGDLSAGEAEGLFEQFHPFLFGFGVVVVQPFFEGAELVLEFQHLLGVVDRRIHLEAVADDAGVAEQPLAVFFREGGDFGDLEIGVGLPEMLLFVEDGRPRQARLVDLED